MFWYYCILNVPLLEVEELYFNIVPLFVFQEVEEELENFSQHIEPS